MAHAYNHDFPQVLSAADVALIRQNRKAALERRSRRAEELLKLPDAPLELVLPAQLPTPTDFGSAFTIPIVDATLLRYHNPHDRDQRIIFQPEGHVYFVDDVPTIGSVTGLVHRFAPHFHAEEVIMKMKQGTKWPRAEYLIPVMPSAVRQLLGALPTAARLLREWDAEARNECAIIEAVKSLLAEHPALRQDLLLLALTDEQIQAKWEANRVRSANLGTWMHLQFELWLNRCPVNEDTPEMNLFFKFITSLRGLRVFRTEWTIFGEEEKLAGSIDCLFIDKAGHLVIVDWKRSKMLRDKYSNPFQKMLTPFDHLEDCAGIHYRLQLNCYRYLLRKYYDFEVSGMLVVCMHPDNGQKAFVDEVPVMISETNLLMAHQRQRAFEQQMNPSVQSGTPTE